MYVDSSAVVKLILQEDESAALHEFLAKYPVSYSSSLTVVEVTRAVLRHAPELLSDAQNVLRELTLLGMDEEVLSRAAHVAPVTLRTLDAIHVASALELGIELEILVTYDQRMADAAGNLGITAASPR
ncbi:MAG: type II toxin-antitoxin system VapC family toxin [Dehalococcoidia bacterium]